MQEFAGRVQQRPPFDSPPASDSLMASHIRLVANWPLAPFGSELEA